MYKIGSFSIIIVENSVESVKKPQYYGIFIKIDFRLKVVVNNVIGILEI